MYQFDLPSLAGHLLRLRCHHHSRTQMGRWYYGVQEEFPEDMQCLILKPDAEVRLTTAGLEANHMIMVWVL